MVLWHQSKSISEGVRLIIIITILVAIVLIINIYYTGYYPRCKDVRYSFTF